jgi:hypothetical protein
MDGGPRRIGAVCVLIVIFTVGSTTERTADRVRSPRETLRGVGMRLSQTHSERELTSVARRAPSVLAILEPTERFALGHGTVELRLDRAAEVSIAACVGHEPFWLADQGFAKTDARLSN